MDGLSTEGAGLLIGFISLVVMLMGLGISGGVAYGKILTSVKNHEAAAKELKESNSLSHKEIYDSLKETAVKLAVIDGHTAATNGSVARALEITAKNDIRITALESKK
jgi:hypothetical protein